MPLILVIGYFEDFKDRCNIMPIETYFSCNLKWNVISCMNICLILVISTYLWLKVLQHLTETHIYGRTKSTITLDWKEPRSNGCPIQGYIIEKLASWQTWLWKSCSASAQPPLFLFRDLDEHQMYEFRVKAVNEIGESEPSLPLNVVIQDDEGVEYKHNGHLNALYLTGCVNILMTVLFFPFPFSLQCLQLLSCAWLFAETPSRMAESLSTFRRCDRPSRCLRLSGPRMKLWLRNPAMHLR